MAAASLQRECATPVTATIVVFTRSEADLTVTLASVARQDGVRTSVILVGHGNSERGAGVTDLRGATMIPARDLAPYLRDAGAEHVTLVRAGDILVRNGVFTACETLRRDNTAMSHPLWIPKRSGRMVSRAESRQHLDYMRNDGRDRLTKALARSGEFPPLSTFLADWLIPRLETASGSFEQVISLLVMRLAADGLVAMAASPGCASAWTPPLVADRPRAPGRLFPWRWMSDQKRADAWDALAAFLRRRRFASLDAAPDQRGRRSGVVAYYQPHYPSLSETFIRREVKALREAGIPLQVFALEPGTTAPMEAGASEGVVYVGHQGSAEGRAFIMEELRRRPLHVLALALWIVRSARGSRWKRDHDSMLLAGQLAAVLKRAGVTHLHAPWADRHSVVAFVAARLIGARFSLQARASEVHRSLTARGLADRLRFADFVITNSEYNERYLRTIIPSGGPALHVIRNGLDLDEFQAPTPGERPAGPLRILTVGRLVEPKGFRHLLHACRRLRDGGHDFTCEIIGGPADPLDTVTWVQLRMLHTKLGLDGCVVFRGAQSFSTVMEAFGKADIFVLPCVRGRDGSHDITPNSLIEAMAMQLPVVSTLSGAVPEIVDDGINGLLVDPGDETALASALERLMRDADLRQALGAAARRKVELHFDARRNAALRVPLFQRQ